MSAAASDPQSESISPTAYRLSGSSDLYKDDGRRRR